MQFGEGNLGAVSTCCYKTALQPDSVFCGECGKPILRCMAYAECGGLLGEDGRCSVCVAPQLYLDKGAVKEVKAGGALVLPLIFANASPIKRPLFITNVWAREGGGQRVPQELAWERLDAGASNPLWVQTGAMERQGRQKLEVSFTIATRYRWREEQFAFLSNLELEVDQGGSPVIHQTINATGGGQGAVGGHTIYAPTTVTTGAGGKVEATTFAAPLVLTRGDQLEKALGVRGYGATGPLAASTVSRAARIVWKGFGKGDAPPAGPIVTSDSILSLGRANLKTQGGDSDVRLLVQDAKGALDETLSRAISRRHIELFIQSGRLYLHAAGEAGVSIGDRRVQRDGIEALSHDDVIHVLPKYAEALALHVRMRAHHGTIEEITITRIPALPEGA